MVERVPKREVTVPDTAQLSDSLGGNYQLRHGVFGLFDSAVVAVAKSAPTHSLAATTGLLVTTVLLGGAAALLYYGVAKFGVVFAFSYLGRVEANSGASYSWVCRALHPALGYL